MINENDCKNRRQAITALVLGELDSEGADELKRHIESCKVCKSLYQELADEEETIRSVFKTIADRSEILQSSIIKKFDDNEYVKDQKSKKAETTIKIIWRKIMKSPITKLATAAAVILAVVTGVTLINKSATPAYALDQTIQAMRSVSSVRAYSNDWDGSGSEGEAVIQINPETGQEECYYVKQRDLLIVATPEKTYYYHKDKNLVRISNKYVIASEVRFSRFIEDMADWVQNHNGNLDIRSEFDQDLQKEVIRIHIHIPAQGSFGGEESIVNVDPKTKLPINFELINEKGKSVVHLEYNVSIPQGLFDFEIPEGAEVVYE